jgi:dCMP deaminase
MSERLSWDQYFMTITLQVAERSTCSRAKVGAVIARDKNILATGYNGAPAGMPHCTDVGCLIYESKTPNGETEQNCFRTIHAEMNAIAQAAKNGSSIIAHLGRTSALHSSAASQRRSANLGVYFCQ